MTTAAPTARTSARMSRRASPVRGLARALTLLAVVLATLAGGYLALVSFRQDRALSAGTIRLSVSPGHRGALDVYVPLVDWGARFEAIRLPARLRVDLRTVDRAQLQRIAQGADLDVQRLRGEARDAIAAYLRELIGVVLLAALALGILTALAVRHRAGPRVPTTLTVAVATAATLAAALIALLPPRGAMAEPQYYAYGADIPRALDAVASIRRSSRALDQELDAQLVGLARIVTAPAGRTPVEGRPRVTIASDLHNNVIAVPVLERAAAGGPVLFAGDLSDRGSPLETALVARIARIGRPFVFVTGNHDSDASARELASDGAVVLTERGSLRRDGSLGPVIAGVDGLRVAGYSDPFQRRASEGYADRFQPTPTSEQQADFGNWMRPLVGRVDVVLVHEPALIEPFVQELAAAPPAAPLTFVVGHTHRADLRRTGTVTVLNGGSIGGGGTGNLADGTTPVALARLTYDARSGYRPLAADLVSIDPGTGAATARRERLDAVAD